MKNAIDILTIISSLLGLLLATAAVWNLTRGVVRRLAIIQHKLDTLKNLFLILRGRMDDVEKFLSIHDGYRIRDGVNSIQVNLLSDYDNQDTGF